MWLAIMQQLLEGDENFNSLEEPVTGKCDQLLSLWSVSCVAVAAAACYLRI